VSRVAILGGSFNPPHLGHMFVCQYILATGRADEVWLTPVYRHAFEKKLLKFSTRMNMCTAIASEFASDKVQLDIMETNTLIKGVNRTLHTMKVLVNEYPEHKFSFIIGSDVLKEKEQWHDFDKIEKLVDIIVVERETYEYLGNSISIPNISSSDIRLRVAEGRDIDHLVHKNVLNYMDELKELVKDNLVKG